MMASPFLCPLPWMHLFINKRGHYRLCCISQDPENKLFHSDGHLMSALGSESLIDLFNVPMLKEVRRQFLANEWPKQCIRCQREEQNGCMSRRQIELNFRQDLIPDILSSTNDDGAISKVFFKEMDVRLGNKCNCACRMCSPQSSLKCLEHWNSVVSSELKISTEEELSLRNINWVESELFISSLKNKLSFLDHINFAGGEPLISSKMPDFLKLLIESGRSNEIMLSYNTNLNHVDDDLWNLWANFKRVKFMVSIDGIGQLNDYIRLGSSWELFEKNLAKLHQFCEMYPQTEVLIFCVVQAYNIDSIDEFIPYLKKYPRFVSFPHFIVLRDPVHLRVSVLPLEKKIELKIKIQSMYEKTEHLLPNHYEHLRENLKGVLAILDEDDTDFYKTFCEYTEKLDKHYGFNR